MGFNEVFGNRKPEPRPTRFPRSCRVCSIKSFKDPILICLGNSNPRIGNGNASCRIPESPASMRIRPPGEEYRIALSNSSCRTPCNARRSPCSARQIGSRLKLQFQFFLSLPSPGWFPGRARSDPATTTGCSSSFNCPASICASRSRSSVRRPSRNAWSWMISMNRRLLP